MVVVYKHREMKSLSLCLPRQHQRRVFERKIKEHALLLLSDTAETKTKNKNLLFSKTIISSDKEIISHMMRLT